jgi:predicted Zn-dependent protease
MASNQPILTLAAAASLINVCFASDLHGNVLERLNNLEPLPPISAELREKVIASLPKEGEIRMLRPDWRQKLASVETVLKVHGRESDYVFKVVDSPQARVAIHARFVVLVTGTALRLLTFSQLQALVAHEIGHDYVWEEYDEAGKRNDWTRLRELELFCDTVAISTLIRIGISPSALIDALRIMEASDRRNGIIWDKTRNSHPSTSDRAWFAAEVSKRLGAGPSPAGR